MLTPIDMLCIAKGSAVVESVRYLRLRRIPGRDSRLPDCSARTLAAPRSLENFKNCFYLTGNIVKIRSEILYTSF